ncbi:MAG: hypothetical protein SCALA702_00520 [Melioribacteraceae bacterium]|nr:MAG: hypothetical protein SCALA702_00520 [Melioribacteraceae bacterium]
MKKYFSFFAIIVSTSLILLNCSSPEEEHINIVKEGVFNDYPMVTIGKFLGNQPNFSKTEWAFQETPQGAKVVAFKGTFNLDNYPMLKELWVISAYIEFGFYAESEMFQPGYSSLLLERFSLENDELFEFTNTKDDTVLENHENEFEYILKTISGETNYLHNLNLSSLRRGLKGALDDYSIEKVKIFQNLGLDLSTVFVYVYEPFDDDHRYKIYPLDYLWRILFEEVWHYNWGREEKEITGLKDSKKEKVLYELSKYLVENGSIVMKGKRRYLRALNGVERKRQYLLESRSSSAKADFTEEEAQMITKFIELIEQTKSAH